MAGLFKNQQRDHEALSDLKVRVSDLEEQALKISTNKNAYDRLKEEIGETRSKISGIGEAIIISDNYNELTNKEKIMFQRIRQTNMRVK